MLEGHSFRPHHEAHFAAWGGGFVSPANPTGNEGVIFPE